MLIGQGVHAVAPVPEYEVPAGQGQHLDWPVALWKKPDGHETQDAAPEVEYRPRAQT